MNCKNCMLPDTFPGVSYDDESNCNFCANYKKLEFLGKESFQKDLEGRTGEKYDCILPISGGLDSTYALYLAKKEMGLKPLAVFYENQFSSEIARKNIEKACAKLNVDLEVFETKNKVEKKFMYHFLKGMVPLGISWGICTFCHYGIAAAIYKTAIQKRIPNIIWAITPYENQLLFPRHSWTKIHHDDVVFNMKDHFNLEFPAFITKPLKKNLKLGNLLPSAYHIFMAAYYSIIQRLELITPPYSNIFRVKPVLRDKDIKEFMIYQYFAWDGKEIEKTLIQEIDFKKPDDRESLWKYDCILFPINDIRWKNAYGISMTGLCCGALIRAGVLDTEEGRKKTLESENQELLRQRIKLIIDEFDLPESYVDKLLEN